MVPRVQFNAAVESEELYVAVKSMWNTDTTTVINCLTSCSNQQRQEIVATFSKKHGKDLHDALEWALVGCTERLALALICSPIRYQAIELHGQLAQRHVDECLLAEMICTKSSAEIWRINAAYENGE